MKQAELERSKCGASQAPSGPLRPCGLEAKLIIPAGTTEAYKAKGWTTLDEGGAFIEIVEAEPETTGLLGDVNGDGQVTIADVTALVNIILGK